MASLRDTLVDRLSAAFGRPHYVAGAHRHWALRRRLYMAPIHIVCDSRDEHPIMWVFNPHHPTNGVRCIVIRTEAEIEPAVALIQEDIRITGGSAL